MARRQRWQSKRRRRRRLWCSPASVALGQVASFARPGGNEMTIAGLCADAVVVLPDPMFVPVPSRLFDAATARCLPATTGGRSYAGAGSLMSYSVNFDDLFRQAALYVDRILRGANSAETPVEQPSRDELIVNLKTARAIGMTVPRPLLLRADEVIE